MSLRSCCEELCELIHTALSVTVENTSQGGTKVDIDLRVQIVDMFCQFFDFFFRCSHISSPFL